MNSAFGQPAFGQSTFGQPQFGSSANNSFAPGNNNNAASTGSSPFGAPSFGSNNNTQQTSAFGQPSFGSNTGSNTAAPAFGQPSFGNTSSNPFGQTGATASPFAQAGSQPSPFSQVANNSTTSPFGQQTGTTNAPAATTSPFGQVAGGNTTASPFGQAAKTGTTNPSPFAQAGNTASPFGQAATATTNTASPFGQAATATTNTASPFGQSAGTTTASPFGQAATKPANPSPFGQTANTTTASPFAQAGTTPSPFGQPAKTENKEPEKPATPAETPKPATPSLEDAASKLSIFGKNKTEEAKPSIFGQNKTPEAKPSIFGQSKPAEDKPSIFGQSKPAEAKPSVSSQSNESKTTTDNTILSADSTSTEDKKLLLSPKKSVPRGLSGASPTKTKIPETPVTTKLEKPVEPKKPELTEKFLETLKNLSITKDLNEKVSIGNQKGDKKLSKDFKPVNFDVSRSLFANNIVDEAVQAIVNKEHQNEFLQHELNNFLFDTVGNKILSKSFTHGNGNTVFFNQNNEIMLVTNDEVKKVKMDNSFKLEDFNNWQISYNGEDLLMFYYKTENKSKFHILDIKINKMTSMKTKFVEGIKKLTWHPLANNSVVVFMTQNNVLYQLNVWTGQLLQISKKILGFYSEQGKNSLSNVFDSIHTDNDFEFENITNFELSDDGWKMYLVDSIKGDLYIIYPFVPLSNKMFTNENVLQDMREEMEWLVEGFKVDKYVDEIVQRDMEEFLFNKNWIKSGEDGNKVGIMSCEVPEDWYLNMGVQGPISFSDFPDALYDHSLVDVKYISNKHENIRQMMVLLYNNGQTVIVYNTSAPVIFRNNWKTLVLSVHELHHFKLFENKIKYEIKELLPSNVEEGCLAVTKNNDIVLLNFIDIFCRCESIVLEGKSEESYDKPCENSLLLSMKQNYSDILLLNSKYVLYYNVESKKLATLMYPSFEYVQGREYSNENNKMEFLSNMLTDVIDEDAEDDEIKPLSTVSTSCLNVFLSVLAEFESEIHKLKSFDDLSNLPLLNVSEDEPEKLLSSMQDIGKTMSKALSLSYSLQTWLRTCLAEYKNTLDDNLENRLVDNKSIEQLVDNIKEITNKYTSTVEAWEKRLTKLQAIKEKVNEAEKLSLKEAHIDASLLETYRIAIDNKILNTLKMMEQMKEFQKDIQFLDMKLSNSEESPKPDNLIAKLNAVKIVDEQGKTMTKSGKELLFSLGP